jgi:hypothetical protein
MNLTIGNIRAYYLDAKRLERITFRASVADDDGNSEAVDLELTGGFTPATGADGAYADDDILGMCRDAAARQNVEVHLSTTLLTKKTPLYVAPPATVLTDAEKRAIWMQQVDDTIGAVLARVNRFRGGYEKREAAASAYKDAGYTGDASEWITGFAEAKGLTSQQAADTILAQGAALHAAELEIDGKQRMRKYMIDSAAGIEEAEAIFNDILVQVRAIEASLP